jgi:hypothetical protein
MVNMFVAITGVLVLLVLAVCIGASLDTEAQRASAREAAHERRERNDMLRALREERRRVQEERRRLRDERSRLRAERLRLADERQRGQVDPPNDEGSE